MRISILFGAVATFQLLVVPPSSAQQIKSCPEGRDLKGDCVNPALLSAMRRNAIANTQPRISYTAPPWLPAEDRGIYITKNYHEMSNIFFPFPRGLSISRATSIKP